MRRPFVDAAGFCVVLVSSGALAVEYGAQYRLPPADLAAPYVAVFDGSGLNFGGDSELPEQERISSAGVNYMF
jgi:hypothetical protein